MPSPPPGDDGTLLDQADSPVERDRGDDDLPQTAGAGPATPADAGVDGGEGPAESWEEGPWRRRLVWGAAAGAEAVAGVAPVVALSHHPQPVVQAGESAARRPVPPRI